MGIKTLFEICCKTVANMIRGKNEAELREILKIPKDPPEEDANRSNWIKLLRLNSFSYWIANVFHVLNKSRRSNKSTERLDKFTFERFCSKTVVVERHLYKNIPRWEENLDRKANRFSASSSFEFRTNTFEKKILVDWSIEVFFADHGTKSRKTCCTKQEEILAKDFNKRNRRSTGRCSRSRNDRVRRKIFVEMFEFRFSVVVDLNNRIIFFITSIRNIRLVRVMRWKFQQHRPDRLENNVNRWIWTIWIRIKFFNHTV